jgi:F-type H+-transporting ATPase subunit gamma
VSDTLLVTGRKIESAGDLQSVVRTMKASAAASVGQFEQAVVALNDYHRAVQLGLSCCFRKASTASRKTHLTPSKETGVNTAIIFGSDQGLVGQFNDLIADFALKSMAGTPGETEFWAVGERVQASLQDAGTLVKGLFVVPSTVQAITPLVGEIQIRIESSRGGQELGQVFVFHNRPQSESLYEPITQRLLPLDAKWEAELAHLPWPTKMLPQVIGGVSATLGSLIREYLFVSLFQACAESLASENASRLAAMQRADTNIGDLLEDLRRQFHRKRQSKIDEELFDVTSGFEALVH